MNCVDCIGSDLPTMIYECSDGKHRCYLHKKAFDGTMTECPRAERMNVASKFKGEPPDIEPPETREAWGDMYWIEYTADMHKEFRDVKSMVKSSTMTRYTGFSRSKIDRMNHSQIQRIAKVDWEKFQNVKDRLPQNLAGRLPLTDTMRELIIKLRGDMTGSQLGKLIGCSTSATNKLANGTRGTVDEKIWRKILDVKEDIYRSRDSGVDDPGILGSNKSARIG